MTGQRPGRPRATVEALAQTDRSRAAWHARGLPWCDDCGQPAALTPGGWRHVDSAGRPVEGSSHRVWAGDWWALGAGTGAVEWTPPFPAAS